MEYWTPRLTLQSFEQGCAIQHDVIRHESKVVVQTLLRRPAILSSNVWAVTQSDVGRKCCSVFNGYQKGIVGMMNACVPLDNSDSELEEDEKEETEDIEEVVHAYEDMDVECIDAVIDWCASVRLSASMTAVGSQCGSSLTHQRFAVIVVKDISNLFRLATLDMKDRDRSAIITNFAFVPYIA